MGPNASETWSDAVAALAAWFGPTALGMQGRFRLIYIGDCRRDRETAALLRRVLVTRRPF
jgi:hypothetical protein